MYLDLLDQLRGIHEQAWNPTAGMVRMLPGMQPGEGSRDTHIVRESALGAYLDLVDGHTRRACSLIDSVLAQQYSALGTPWQGTFRVRAEQPDPPPLDAIEWYHYDPNWRQFLGVILALCIIDFEDSLGTERSQRILNAIGSAIAGEPPSRIPDWYTNPNMLHAWLQSWYGQRVNDAELARSGTQRLATIDRRLEEAGDIDEYNSPTYDGIDLFAAGLWATFPPTEQFRLSAMNVIAAITGRLNILYDRPLGAICGPHLRAYGLDMNRYVSLIGIWLAIAGEAAAHVLPAPLDATSVHVHDLYFLPCFKRVAAEVLPLLELGRGEARQHRQRFGHIVASSSIVNGVALGAESGRLPDFAKDQYMPVTAHAVDSYGSVGRLGLKLGWLTGAIDAAITSPTTMSGILNAAPINSRCDVVVLTSNAPTVNGPALHVGPIEIIFDPAPAHMDVDSGPAGVSTRLTFTTRRVEFRLAITNRENDATSAPGPQ
jgi:hypothetical protein